jgi:hypothetical protein
MPDKARIQVTGIYPPAIAVLNNRTVVVPSWTEVPAGTTLADIDWIRPKQVTPKMTVKHVGKYLLNIYDNGAVKCDCPGFTYRKKCKHSAEFLR